MQPIVTDHVAWSISQSVTVVSPAKTAEPIEMPFRLRAHVDPRNHVLYGDPDPRGKGNFAPSHGEGAKLGHPCQTHGDLAGVAHCKV